ncbi:Stress-activated PKC1-MPK1 kinase pathway sensor [Saxophila tyrrhenica]|uniref:Stress-activated PKC1-MPK1 kinase pathway sensor n=1 Tax=Saxophila tyrrhenica TaxID=1690608 RepID=A0AAV9PLF9_9PEZI|nr:Stress-activated PKC1-MPK1 kinase pathway sensor [Saxophila tyrrhenica]
MPSTPRTMSAPLLVLAFSAMAAAQGVSLIGCYSSIKPLTNQGTDRYQSSGACSKTCARQNAATFAMSRGNLCFCGNMLPAESTQTDDSECDTPCVGYPDEMCGGPDAYSVYLSGTEVNVPVFGSTGGDDGDDSSDSSGSSSSAPPTTSTSTSTSTSTPPTTTATRTRRPRPRPTVVTSVNEGTTVYVTNTPTPRPVTTSSATPTPESSSPEDSGTNIGAVAGGVVVGVVAIAGIVFGVWFYLRRRKQKEAEEEYKRTQVADFMRGGGNGERKPPNTGYSHSSDSRLDPGAGARRDSQGSIADAGDYSRRILRVANPDNS